MKSHKFSHFFIVILGSLILTSCTNSDESTIQSSNATNSSTVSATSSDTSSTSSKTVHYRTDHGKHTVSITFNISTGSDGTITAIQASMNSGDHESAEYITRFNNAARSKIIGKKVSALSLSSVGGASDTTKAFLSLVPSL